MRHSEQLTLVCAMLLTAGAYAGALVAATTAHAPQLMAQAGRRTLVGGLVLALSCVTLAVVFSILLMLGVRDQLHTRLEPVRHAIAEAGWMVDSQGGAWHEDDAQYRLNAAWVAMAEGNPGAVATECTDRLVAAGLEVTTDAPHSMTVTLEGGSRGVDLDRGA